MIRTFFQRSAAVLTAILLLSASISSWAELSAHDVVRDVTRKMEQVLVSHQEGVYADNAAFEVAIGEVLDPVVSYKFIVRNVMGKKVYEAASDEQRKAFTKTFKKVLMSTYAKAMINFGEIKIEVIPPLGKVEGKRRINVIQEVTTVKDIYRISYVMGCNRNDEWRLINVVLARANLGLVFAGQFKSALVENNNDLDVVIRSWGRTDSGVAEGQTEVDPAA